MCIARWSAVASLTLVACRLPSADLPEQSPSPAVFSEAVRDEPDPNPAQVRDITPGECPPEVGDYPLVFFEDRVLLRMPKGIHDGNFVEVSPAFARLSGEVESSNCHSGMPGALITFAAMTLFEDDPSKSLDTMRAELLEAFGYPADTTLIEAAKPRRKPRPRGGMWVYEVPASMSSPEPARMLMAIVTGNGVTVVLVFETHPNAWSVVVNSLLASASRLLILVE